MTGLTDEISKVHNALDEGKRSPYSLTANYNGTDVGQLQRLPPDSALSLAVNGRSVADVTGGTDSKFDLLEFDADSSGCAAITVVPRSTSAAVTVGPIGVQSAPEPIGAHVPSDMRCLAFAHELSPLHAADRCHLRLLQVPSSGRMQFGSNKPT